MYKMIIVDDEENVRNVIKNIIDWDNLGIEICAEASNGYDAVCLIDLYKPELVITDIHMPIMNGIELIKKCKDTTKFIVLSGYIDFEYVKNSMKFGALNYILKPITAEEISEAMLEALNILDNSVQIPHEKQSTDAILLENTLNRLIQGNISLKEFKEKSELLNIDLRHPRLLTGLIHLTNEDIVRTDGGCINVVKDIISEIVLREFKGHTFYDNLNNIIFVIAIDDNQDYDGNIISLMESAIIRMNNDHHLKAVGAIGLVVSHTHDLERSYKSALVLLEYQILLPNQTVFSQDIAVEKVITEEFIPTNPHQLSEMLQQHDLLGVQNYIHDFLRNEYKKYDNSLNLKYYAIEIASSLFSGAAVLDISQRELSIIRQDYIFSIKNCINEHQYIEVLNQLAMRIISILSKVKKYSPKIIKIVDEIEENYSNQNISLKTFAYSLNVNSAYLGRQFKIETGHFFSDYLNSIRIAKAKKLLETTDLSAAEISESVGFTTSNYFYGLFKKITGVSTSYYRSLFQ